MGEIIRADWFDLDEATREDTLRWLHQSYFPSAQATPGVCWVGHYEIVPLPDKPYIEGAPRRVETTDPSLPTGWQNVVLTAAVSPEVFFGKDNELDALAAANESRLSALLNHRSAVYLEEQVINAPEQRASPYGMGPPPAMQLGNYNTNTPEDDVELARWYRAERFARVSVTPGMIRGRKLLSIAGWAKHGVLWEFTDLPEGDHSFEHRFVAADRNEDWGGRHVLEYVTHAYGSPHAGRRIWPEAR
ncbi:hypothetical protein [Tropicimonas sediminicola]|uniref:Uncharacterized protein n=1 Tax=Tropicimonas sediminicola TaxID=1031541 RepID=A0A239I064_9RHOB|nr:hypothetical protein [Tropicimonas sediminicola]SNS87030.1 hypothetical protein SAMN05421757_104130 [Tropicimonas sediminicola]